MQTQMYSNEELRKKYCENTKLFHVVKDLEKQEWSRGRVICEIHLNGNYLSEDEEKILKEMPLTNIKVLEVITRDQSELVEVTLRTLCQWLPKLKERSIEISSFLAKENYTFPTQLFIELIDGCTWLNESLSLLRPKLQKIVNSTEFEKNWEVCQSSFTIVAKEALKSFELSDWVLLKDILEYDMPPALDQWQELLFMQPEVVSISKI